jgi:hypothetical protein
MGRLPESGRDRAKAKVAERHLEAGEGGQLLGLQIAKLGRLPLPAHHDAREDERQGQEDHHGDQHQDERDSLLPASHCGNRLFFQA